MHKFMNKVLHLCKTLYPMVKEKLRNARKSKGYTQEQLAEIICRTPTNYCRKENGDIKISKEEWTKLAKFLEVPEEEIFEQDENSVTFNIDNISDGKNFGIYNYYSNVNEELLAHVLDLVKILKNENEELKKKLGEN